MIQNFRMITKYNRLKMFKVIDSRLKNRRKAKGTILIVSLLVMAVMLIIGIPLLFKLSNQYRSTEKSYKSLAALNLAEAGVERAIWELNYGDVSSWGGDVHMRNMTVSSLQASDGNVVGDIDINISDPEGDSPVIEATGRVPYIDTLTVDKTIRVVLKKGGGPGLFDYGIFGDDGVDLDSNAKTDSYDSRDGLYGDSNMGSKGHVGTNATHYGCVSLDSNAKIFGNAYSGPESNPEEVIILRSNSHIYGEKQSLSRLKELPSVPLPEGLPNRGDYFLGSNNQDTISESGLYSSFRLKSNSKVTVTSDVTFYITGDFSMRSNTQLDIAEAASLTIYLGGTFEQRSNTQINNLSKDPSKLIVFGTDSFNGEMEWNSNSQFWGAVYVPRANVIYNSNTDFHGSITCNHIHMDSNGKIHYDEALGGLDVLPGSEGSYIVKSWQEKRTP